MDIRERYTSQDDLVNHRKVDYLYLKLCLFIISMFAVYMDRGAFAAMLSEFEESFSLDNFQGGVLTAVFMIGFATGSLVFASLVKNHSVLLLTSIGTAIWSLAVLGGAVSFNFTTFAIARACVGIGEASLLTIASSFIDTHAPIESRSQWMGGYFAQIPVGFAIGNAIGSAWIGWGEKDWRSWLIVCGLFQVPIAIIFFALRKTESQFEYNQVGNQSRREDILLRSPRRKASERESTRCERLYSIIKTEVSEIFTLLRSKLLMLLMFGNAAVTFTIGSFSIFVIQYMQANLGTTITESGILFGTVTALSGSAGSYTCGWYLDRKRRRYAASIHTERRAPRDEGEAARDKDCEKAYSVFIASDICFKCICIALPISALSFAYAFNSISGFTFSLFFTEFFVLGAFTPYIQACLWATPVWKLRALSVAMSAFVGYVFGDAMSPILIGEIINASGWQNAMFVTCGWLIFGIVLWGLARRVAMVRWKEEESSF
jgi:MFS family permease